MMQIQWVVKTPPAVKAALREAAVTLSEGNGSQRIAARLLVEVFDLKIKLKGI